MVQFKIIQTTLFLFSFLIGFSQISESEIISDGIIYPRFTDSEKLSINPIQGQCIYNTTTNGIECYSGTEWLGTQNQVSFLGHSGPSYILSNEDFQTIDGLRIRDSSNSFNGTTFTAPQEGFYYFEGNIEFSRQNGDIEDGIVSLSFGSSGFKRFRIKLDDRNPRQNIIYSKTLYLVVGETARFQVSVDTGGPDILLQNGSTSTNNQKIRFLGYKVASKTPKLF